MQVTKESVEKYFNSYLDSRKKAKQIETSITELRYKLLPGGVDNTKTKVMASYQDRISALTAEIDKLQRQLDHEQSKADRLKKRIYADIVKAYPDKKITYRKVLVLRYLHGKSITDISNLLGVTDRHVLRLKKQALDNFVEIKGKQSENG